MGLISGVFATIGILSTYLNIGVLCCEILKFQFYKFVVLEVGTLNITAGSCSVRVQPRYLGMLECVCLYSYAQIVLAADKEQNTA